MSHLSTTAPSKRGFGCLGYGCLIAIVLTVVIIGGLLWGARTAIRNAAETFTTEKPVPVPQVSMDLKTRDAATEKIKAAASMLMDPVKSGEFTLTQDEVRWFLEDSPFRGRAFVELKSDSVAGTFSFSLRALGEWQAARPILGDIINRYVTGSAEASVSVDAGVASVTFANLTLNGQVFDGDSLKEANEWVSGFLNSLEGEESGSRALSRVGSLRVRNGEILVALRPLPTDTSSAVTER